MSVHRFLLVVPLIALAACSEPKAPPLAIDPPVSKLAERVYVVHGPNEIPDRQNRGFINNPGFVRTSKGVVVIDPGSSARVGELVLTKIAGVTSDPVIAVFNTHVHADHWLANQAIKAAFPQAVIYAHANMKARAAAEGSEWLERLDRLTDGALRGTRPLGPDTTIDHDEVLKLGDRRFRIYHNGKAHSDGDIMIEVVEDKVMFTGDNVLAGRLRRMDDGHFLGNIAAIDMALQSGALRFVPGHGPGNGRETLRVYQDYLKTLYAEVRREYELDPTNADIKTKVLPALARYREWKDFDVQVGRHVMLIVQELEAAP